MDGSPPGSSVHEEEPAFHSAHRPTSHQTPLLLSHPILAREPCASAHRGLLSVPCESLVTPSLCSRRQVAQPELSLAVSESGPRSAASHQPVYTPCHSAQSLQSGPALCLSVHGILQARILEWVAMPSSRGSSSTASSSYPEAGGYSQKPSENWGRLEWGMSCCC